MYIKFKTYVMQASTWICTYQMQPIKVLHSSMLLPLCPCPTTTSPHDAFTYLCFNFSPFVINFHKRCASYWYKGLHWGRWLTLESCIFYGQHNIWWNDTSCRIFDLDTNWWGTSPYVNAWVILLDKLEPLYVRGLFSLDDHLKLRITCGTTIWCARYHLYECYL